MIYIYAASLCPNFHMLEPKTYSHEHLIRHFQTTHGAHILWYMLAKILVFRWGTMTCMARNMKFSNRYNVSKLICYDYEC